MRRKTNFKKKRSFLKGSHNKHLLQGVGEEDKCVCEVLLMVSKVMVDFQDWSNTTGVGVLTKRIEKRLRDSHRFDSDLKIHIFKEIFNSDIKTRLILAARQFHRRFKVSYSRQLKYKVNAKKWERGTKSINVGFGYLLQNSEESLEKLKKDFAPNIINVEDFGLCYVFGPLFIFNHSNKSALKFHKNFKISDKIVAISIERDDDCIFKCEFKKEVFINYIPLMENDLNFS